MKSQKNHIILSKTIGANGPSMGLGVPIMMFGIVAILFGAGLTQIIAIFIGLLLLVFASFLILSIDCIALDKTNNQLYIYKDYLITKTGKKFPINDFKSVCIFYLIDKAKTNFIGAASTTWHPTQLKTFSVVLVSADDKKLLLKEFGNLEKAKQLQQLISSETKLELITKAINEKLENR